MSSSENPFSGIRFPIAAILSLAVLSSFPVFADDAAERHPPIPQTDGRITVDGRLDEAIWSQAAALELPYETEPADNAPADVRTEAWLIHSDTHLYVAFRAHDPEPERIRAYYRERGDIFGDDMVSVTLDPYNGQRRGYQLFVNPLGVQADTFINELAGSENPSFDFLWDSAGRLTSEGYEVEMAIPLSSLRFPPGEGLMNWGIDLVRFYPREHSYRFALSPMERGRDCYLCQIQTMRGFEDVAGGRNLELTPELSLAAREIPGPDGDTTESDENLGLTAQWALTPGLTLAGTVNPDFSQVAADPLQLDINQPFGIQREERRPFFQEAADLFTTPLEAVQTRNLVEPAGGIKLAGQVGRQALGFFHVQDRQLNLIRPGVERAEFLRLERESESTALRLRRDVLNDSAVGLLMTHREAEAYENSVAAVDGQLRFTDSDTVRYQWATSETRDHLNTSGGTGGIDTVGDARLLRYQHEGRHLFGGLEHQRRDEGFRADLGFLPQTDFEQNAGWLGLRWYGDGDGFVREADVVVDHRRSDTISDDQPLSEQEVIEFGLEGGMQSRLSVAGKTWEQWHAGDRYEGERWAAYFQLQPLRGLRLQAEAGGGDQIDFVGDRLGESRRIGPRLIADIGRHLEVDFAYRRAHLDLPQGRLYQARTHELRAGWFFGVRSYLRLISQLSDIERNPTLYAQGEGDDDVVWANQLTFTWRLDPRTEFITGYTDRRSGTQRQDLTLEGRRVFVKMSYAFQI